MIQRYEINIQGDPPTLGDPALIPSDNGNLLLYADAEKWGEEVATLTEALANQRRRMGTEYDDLMEDLKTIQLNALAEIAALKEAIKSNRVCIGYTLDLERQIAKKDEEIATEIALLRNERDEALRKSALDQKQCDEMTTEAARMNEEIAALKEEGQEAACINNHNVEVLSQEITALKEKIKKQDEAVYCPTCGACGEDGCCPPDRCEHLKCFYGEQYAKTYRDLEAENETLRSLVDGAMTLVSIWGGESPAQKVWKAEWLAKAGEALK